VVNILLPRHPHAIGAGGTSFGRELKAGQVSGSNQGSDFGVVLLAQSLIGQHRLHTAGWDGGIGIPKDEEKDGTHSQKWEKSAGAHCALQ
jgi:hypothetical protein